MRHYRKGNGEALTEARVGQVLSPEMSLYRDADAVKVSGRQHHCGSLCENHGSPAGSETLCMFGNTLRENREVPYPSTGDGSVERIGKSMDTSR